MDIGALTAAGDKEEDKEDRGGGTEDSDIIQCPSVLPPMFGGSRYSVLLEVPDEEYERCVREHAEEGSFTIQLQGHTNGVCTPFERLAWSV